MGIMLFYLFCVVVATEAVTELAIKSQIFLPLRRFLSSKSQFMQELLSCGYCFSVWVATAAVLSVGISIPLSEWGIVNYGISILVVHRLSNVLHNVIDKWTDKYYDTGFVNTVKASD